MDNLLINVQIYDRLNKQQDPMVLEFQNFQQICPQIKLIIIMLNI